MPRTVQLRHDSPRPPNRLARAAAGLLLAAAGVGAAGGGGATLDEARRLAIGNEILGKQAELASGDQFYLILDPSAARLTLYLQAAELFHYDVLGLEVADPQVAFVSRGESLDWQARIWNSGVLSPAREQDRIEIKVPPPGADPAQQPAVIPLTPEEAHPVPPRYGIRYPGGLFVEVRFGGDTAAPATLGGRLGVWWQDFKDAIRNDPTDRIRLRLTLRSEDGKALYRSLPPDTKLLILPPR